MIVLPWPRSTTLAAGAVDIDDLLGVWLAAGCALQHVMAHGRPGGRRRTLSPTNLARSARHGPGTAAREPARGAARRLLDLARLRPAARPAADRPAVPGRGAGRPARPHRRRPGRPAPPVPVLTGRCQGLVASHASTPARARSRRALGAPPDR